MVVYNKTLLNIFNSFLH